MFKQLLEELSNIKKEVENKIRILEEMEEEVERLTQENQSLKDEIANHVCEKEVVEVPVEVLIPCNHEEEIEVLKSQVISITAEKEELEKQHEENVLALQAEIEQLKKLLATS